MTKKYRHKTKPFEFNGAKGIIVYDRLIADGPVDPETGSPLINPVTGKRFPGANDDMAQHLKEHLLKLKSQVNEQGETISRFGFLGNLAVTTPIYLYDHIALQELCQTAFTDGYGVFLNADFYRKMKEEEDKFNVGTGKFGVLPVLLHELYHKAKFHTTRMKDIPHGIANRAQDRNINANLKLAFGKDLPFIPMLSVMMEAGSDAAAEKWATQSEEIIGRQMLNEYAARKKEIMDKGKKKKQKGSGGGGGGGGGQSGGQPDDEFNPDAEDNKEESDNYDNDTKKALQDLDDEFNGDIHHYTIEEIADLLAEEGLEHIAEALNYPKSSQDTEGLERTKETLDRCLSGALQKTRAEMNSLPNPSGYPGGHILEEVSSMVRELRTKKLSWQLDFTRSIVGESPRQKLSEDETTVVYHCDFGDGMKEIYDPAMIGQKSNEVIAFIFDTSASTKQGDLRVQIATEAIGLVEANQYHENAKEVVFVSGDTILRGEPLIITAANVDILRKEGVPLFGDGGTNLKECLVQLQASDVMKNKKIKHIIYGTDCEDGIPDREPFEELLSKGGSVTFLSTRNCFSEKWSKELTWANVAYIEEGSTVNLDSSRSSVVGNEKNAKSAARI